MPACANLWSGSGATQVESTPRKEVKKMAEEKTQPTVAELEAKVQRLAKQVEVDSQVEAAASDGFTKAVKSGNVDRALELADERTAAKAASAKSTSQLKSAQSAVASAKHALNADKIAALHDGMRSDPAFNNYFQKLEGFGIKRVTLERSEETGKLLVNSTGPSAPKKARASSDGGSHGTASWEVGGQTFTSRELIDAHPEMLSAKTREHYDSGNFRAFSMTREAERIHKQLTEA